MNRHEKGTPAMKQKSTQDAHEARIERLARGTAKKICADLSANKRSLSTTERAAIVNDCRVLAWKVENNALDFDDVALK